MSLITKWNWRDAGQFYEADQGSGDGGEQKAEGGATLTTEQLQAELEQTRKALKAANKEAQDRRKKLDEIEAADKERKDKDLGETEKERKRAEQAEQRLLDLETRQRETTIRYAVEMAATKLNFHDAQDAYRLADLTTVDLTDDGKVDGVDKALKALADAKPHLIKQAGNADINAQNRGRNQQPSIDDLVAAKRASGQYAPL